MRIAKTERLTDGIRQTGHRRLAGPVELGQRLTRIKRVHFKVGRHPQPVEAPNVFAPAQDLPDETFHRGQVGAACTPGRLRGFDHFKWRQELQIQCGGKQRVIEPGFARPDRILPAAKAAQPAGDEVIQGDQGVLARDRPAKFREIAGVRRKARIDQPDHVGGDVVGGETAGRGQHARALGAKGLAIVGIEVPLSPSRAPTVGRTGIVNHQHIVASPHLAIEIFQAQLLASGSVTRKLYAAAQEVSIAAHLKRHTQARALVANCLEHPPVARFGHHHRLRHRLREGLFEGAGKRCGRPLRAIERVVVNRPASRLERPRKVTHGRQKHRDPLFAARNMSGFLDRLAHPESIERRVEAVEGARLQVQLIAQHQNPVAGRS